MPAKDVISRLYGVKTDTAINPLVAQVGTAVVQLLRPNPNRLAWTLINLGATALYVAYTPDPSATRGIYVAQNGGDVIHLISEDFDLVTFPLYGISTGVCDIYLIEVFEV